MGIAPGTNIVVTRVLSGGPAEKAGIQPGDILMTVNGHRVSQAAVAINTVQNAKPGTPLLLRLVRDGREYEVSVVTELLRLPDAPKVQWREQQGEFLSPRTAPIEREHDSAIKKEEKGHE
jgi:serine protease DegQ